MILSICIPTHNKTSYLDQSLSRINKIINNNLIEVVISDNSQNQDTLNLYKKKLCNFSYIKYFRNPDILNMDDNIENAISKANGEYVWILGDDDLIEEDSLDYILKNILEKKYPIYIINSKSFSGENHIIEFSRNFLKENKIYNEDDNDIFLKEMGGYVTFISSIIVSKKLWVEIPNNEYRRSWFSHLAKILIIKKNSKALFLSKILVNMRVFSQTWSEDHFEIWNILYPKILWSLSGYNDESKTAVIKKNPLNSFSKIFSACAYNNYNFKIYNKFIKNNDNIKPFYKFSWLLALFIPNKIFNYLYICIIILNIKKNSSNFSQQLALAQLRSK